MRLQLPVGILNLVRAPIGMPQTVDFHDARRTGSRAAAVLVFLPGLGEIRRVQEKLQEQVDGHPGRWAADVSLDSAVSHSSAVRKTRAGRGLGGLGGHGARWRAIRPTLVGQRCRTAAATSAVNRRS